MCVVVYCISNIFPITPRFHLRMGSALCYLGFNDNFFSQLKDDTNNTARNEFDKDTVSSYHIVGGMTLSRRI